MTHQAVTTARPTNIFSSLRHRDFRLLWISVLFTSSGQWMEQVALGWLVFEMTDSAFMLGAVMFCRAVPFLIFGSIGGVIADRIDRRNMMAVGQAVLTLLILLLSILIIFQWIQVWHVFVIAFSTGIVWSFLMPVRQALVPDLVGKDDLMNAISLNSAAFQATRIFGPALAGFLVGAIGVGGTFLFETAAHMAVIFIVLAMRVPANTSSARHASMMQNLGEGFQYVLKSPVVLSLLLLAMFPMVFGMPYATLMPVFARDVLNIGASGLGILMSAPGIGALAAALTLAGLNNFKKKGWLLLAGACLFGVFLVAFAVTAWLPLALFFLVMLGLSSITFMAVNNTLLQTIVPNEVRGRVMGIYSLDMGLVPFGSLLAGGIASIYGAPAALAFMGAALAIFVVIMAIMVPALRKLE